MAAAIRIAEPGNHGPLLPFIAEGGTSYPSALSVVKYGPMPDEKPIYYRYLGALYRVAGLSPTVDAANAVMVKNEDVGLLAVTDDGWHVLVKMTDKGISVEAA